MQKYLYASRFTFYYENIEQIRRVEELSDAYHLYLGQDDVMVMYLLEATWKRSDRDA